MAVVGAGYWGPNLVRNIQATSDVRLRWVCDLDRDRAAQVVGSYSTVQVTDQIDDVLSDPEVEAVAVATPAATHFDLARRCIESGRHVLVEKPLAATFSEGQKLVELADTYGVTLMCDHTYCYTSAVQKIHDLVASGTLGDVQYVDSVRINLGLVQRDIDVVWDLAPHDLSILDFVLPPDRHPTAVSAHGADPVGTGRACVAYLTLPLASDGIAHAHVNWLSPLKIRTTIIGGSKRMLVWDDLNPTQRLSVYDRGVDLAGPDELEDAVRRQTLVSYRSGDVVAPALQEVEALRRVVSEFAAAIRERRPALTDGRSGLRVLDVLEAASRSLEFGGAVVPLRTYR
jgi:predicted dehydrogenase